MEEYDSVGNVDNLLFQLVLQTRELSQKKDEVEKQNERCKLDIAEKKTLLKETKQNIEKLEEDITKRENLMKYHKINSKRLKATNNLLMQYEKTLQHDLERKQEIFNHDVKMFQERIETYRMVFEEHQARYFENSLVQKLVSAQAENDGIEQRIRACEEQIVAKGRELQALQGVAPDPPVTECASGRTAEQQGLVEPQGEADPQAEASAPVETGFPSGPLTPQQDLCLEGEQEDGGCERVETLSQKEKPSDEVSSEENATPSSPVVSDHMDAWLSHEAAGEVAGPSQEQTDAKDVQEEGLAVFGGAGTEQREGGVDVLKLFSCGEEEEQGGSGGFPQNPPARMSAVQTTPTFSLRTSPCGSPGPFKPSEGKSPTFFFSMSMTPETAQFPGFSCSFEGESPKEVEDIPFSFTSSYFENKKLLDSKSSGFLMDQMESQADEEFELFFSNKSPNQTSAGQKQGEASNAFFFNFGQP